MEKNILIVIAGQLRTWAECKWYLQRLINHMSNYCSVDVLFVIPNNFECVLSAEHKYTYTSDDLKLDNCTVTTRIVEQFEIDNFVKLNYPQQQWSEKVSHFPLINFWYYRLVSVFEKNKLEQNKIYDSVCFTRPDSAYMEPFGDFVKNVFPGIILERDDTDRFSKVVLENKRHSDGTTSGSVTRLRNDLVEQMSSSTYDLYNSALLHSAEYHDVDIFGSMTYHEIPSLLSNDFFTYEPHDSNNGFMEYSTNDMLQRGNLIRFNYVVINSTTPIADRLESILDRYTVFSKEQGVSQFVFRKVFVGSPDQISNPRVVHVSPGPNARRLARHELKKYFDSLGYDIEPNQLDFKTLTLIDADQIDWDTEFKETLDYQSEPGMMKTTFSIL